MTGRVSFSQVLLKYKIQDIQQECLNINCLSSNLNQVMIQLEFDSCTPSIRKVDNGDKVWGGTGKQNYNNDEIVAPTSLSVNCPTATDCNAIACAKKLMMTHPIVQSCNVQSLPIKR